MVCVISSANVWRKFENRRSTAAADLLEPSPSRKPSDEGTTAVGAAHESAANASELAWGVDGEGDGATRASAGGGVMPNSLSSAGEMSELCEEFASCWWCCRAADASFGCCDGGVCTCCPTLAIKRSSSGEVSGDEAVDCGGEGMPAGTGAAVWAAAAASAAVGESSHL